MTGKIALEEHFAVPDTLGDSEQYAVGGTWDGLSGRLLDLGSRRLDEMDRHGIDLAVLSLNSPAVQAVHDPGRARDLARRANDTLADAVARHPTRFAGFAALPMQDVDEASRELERAVGRLGFRGALVNGFSQVGAADRVVYYDDPRYLPFWATAERLGVPVYLHPRDPLLDREPVYVGHPWFQGSAWAFGVETAIHALRLMASGLFDRHPALNIILGHLGEGIPFGVWRLDHRLQKSPRGIRAERPMADYLRRNVYVTTSGNFHTPALLNTITEIGVDRVMFSVDYPFENTADAAAWFDGLPLGEEECQAVARLNAARILGLGPT